jgi:hypothetical protein
VDDEKISRIFHCDNGIEGIADKVGRQNTELEELLGTLSKSASDYSEESVSERKKGVRPSINLVPTIGGSSLLAKRR